MSLDRRLGMKKGERTFHSLGVPIAGKQRTRYAFNSIVSVGERLKGGKSTNSTTV